VRITVLGKSPAWQDAGGACSGYLVEAAGLRLLLDCGPGVLAKLRERCDYAAVDAVVLSHLHADHIFDIVSYASGLRFGRPGRCPALHVPPGGREHLARLCEAGSLSADHVERAFALREYDPAETLGIGDLRLRFAAVPHFVPTWAIEVADGGARLTYGADCAPSDALVDFARDTGLLIAEATLPEPDAEPRGHMTAREAGELGARARARRLLVTHYSDELDAGWVAAEAAAGYGAEADLAAEGAGFEVKLDPSPADAVK
jgi:ribonuclease BN (tRNA processing enzyme)